MNREALVQAILDLKNDREHRVEDPATARDLGEHLKPYIDQLWQQGPNSMASSDPGTAQGTGPAKNRRKVQKAQGPPTDITLLSPRDQARWILLDRFIPLEKHEEILGLAFESDYFESYESAFEEGFATLLQMPRLAAALAKNDLEALQRYFAPYVLIFRNAQIAPTAESTASLTVETLRQRFPEYFFKRSQKPNWFERHPFYTEPISQPHWALCPTEYLNCTLRPPAKRVAAYAKHWQSLGLEVRQKNLLEEVYDRIICGEALEDKLFAPNGNYCTSTEYRNREKSRLRLVYIVQQETKIGIHGKIGIPHWHWKKRYWPGVLPSIILS